jgi:histone demethylase JARID1
MQKRRGHNVIFYKRLKRFMLEEKGKRTIKTYNVDGIEIDLYRLHLEIRDFGGYDEVEKGDQWSEIAAGLRLPYCNSTVVATLRRSYQNCLKDFVENESEMEGFLQEINDNDAVYEERQRSKPKQVKERESKPKATQLSFSGARGIKSYGTRTHPMTSSDWKDIKLQSFGHNLKATIEDVTCTICGRGDRPDKLVVCDNNCNRGTHIHCMDPPLARVPKGEWLCEKCVKSTEEEREELEYGYDMGKQYTLTQFERMATQFECNWFGVPYEQEESDDEDDDNDKMFKKQVRKQAKIKDWVDPNVVEKEYWRIVEGTDDRVVVYYGSDVDVHEHGCSGFPLDTQSTAEPVRARALKTKGQFIRDATAEAMAKSGWNLNNLPYVSALKHLRQNISGVTRPMMYVGMLFSSFCWHTEDNLLYSINYVHMGKPKNWYGVSGRYAAKFEEVMKQTMPDLFEKHPNLLHMLITMLSPRILQANGIPVVRTIQNAGEFVITFPNAYHAGFNQGFNCAESVNFALPDWIEQGRTAVEMYRFKRSSVFPHAEFVISAALDLIKEAESSGDTASEDEDGSEKKTEQIEPYDLADFRPRIKSELERIINAERQDRQRLQKAGLTRIVPLTTKQLKEECKQCDVCGFDCYVSGVVCDCNNAISFCLSHAEGRCNCEISRKKIQYRFELKLLEEALQHLEEIMENSE